MYNVLYFLTTLGGKPKEATTTQTLVDQQSRDESDGNKKPSTGE